MPHQNKLYLSIHLEAELKTICNHTYNPNLVLSAMKDAIESSMWMVRKKCVVEFLCNPFYDFYFRLEFVY